MIWVAPLVDVTDRVCTVTLNRPEAVRHLKALYDANARLTVGDAIRNERDVFDTYTVDFAEVERRRADVVERGRRQQQ